MLRLFTVCVFAALVWAAPAHAISSADAIARINVLRTDSGLPPLVEDPALTAGCQAHARYMALNGGWDADDAHDQTPGRPGYSAAGADAARQSVLAGPTGWADPHPWAASPTHLRKVMDPELERSGYGEHDGWMCLQVLKAPRPDLMGRVFTFPGPRATLTDPRTLVVFTPGADVSFGAPRLSGPDGPVEIVSTAPYLRPRGRLAAGTTYTAEVDLRYPAEDCSREGAPPVHPQCPAHFAPWCYASADDFEPTWLPAEAEPYDPVLCAPGERPPASPNATVKSRTMPFHWQFTTPGAPVTCPPALTAPTRLANGTTMNVHARLCGAGVATAEILRGNRVVRTRTSRLAFFRVSTRTLPAGRYRLRVTVGATVLTHAFSVRV
ncbi:CAP domain-containing protein [Solirubrobacter sp. CPCC 204708]|uniref:CAP domain-containing protein n=1 Tax=Solirubrobacter deserti TaxID=2282478 RepID=A0ABT4RU26_9ACTN|nr:CAP domain-containing protein [Solirubrobacter deserti]MBE2314476.1 CAP domain-containing protein [Solirubrobacter deserti]MDA0142083.1 CAP domain-containing protein [Solirubrobacter deserti]